MIISLICDILLSIVFASIILILFFFIHVVPNEQNILHNNLNYLIDNTFKDLYVKDIINSNVLSNIVKNNKQYLNQRCALLRDFKKINKYYFAVIYKII